MLGEGKIKTLVEVSIVTLDTLDTYEYKAWRSGESTRLPPLWPGFDSSTWCCMWVEFVVGSHPCSEGFSPSIRSYSLLNHYYYHYYNHYNHYYYYYWVRKWYGEVVHFLWYEATTSLSAHTRLDFNPLKVTPSMFSGFPEKLVVLIFFLRRTRTRWLGQSLKVYLPTQGSAHLP